MWPERQLNFRWVLGPFVGHGPKIAARLRASSGNVAFLVPSGSHFLPKSDPGECDQSRSTTNAMRRHTASAKEQKLTTPRIPPPIAPNCMMTTRDGHTIPVISIKVGNAESSVPMVRLATEKSINFLGRVSESRRMIHHAPRLAIAMSSNALASSTGCVTRKRAPDAGVVCVHPERARAPAIAEALKPVFERINEPRRGPSPRAWGASRTYAPAEASEASTQGCPHARSKGSSLSPSHRASACNTRCR